MDSLWTKITEWIKEALIGGITSNYQGLFDELNTKVVEIADQVGQTPEGFNSDVFHMVKNLSETVIIPIAGIILTFVLCYELIQMVIERNNMAEFDLFNIYKWIFKTFCAVYILTHTFDIVMGIFELAQYVVNQSSHVIGDSLNVELAMSNLQTQLEAMEWYELLGLYMESSILKLAMTAISICIFIVITGRMLEIYLTVSIAPIPLSTMVNREWGHTGTNYLKGLFALAFQGFLIIVCVAIYGALLVPAASSEHIHTAVWTCAGYTVLLCFTLFKTGSLSKNLFGAH